MHPLPAFASLQWLLALFYTIAVAAISIAWMILSPKPGEFFAAFFALCLLAAKFGSRSDRQRYIGGALALLAIIAGQVFAPLDYYSFRHIAFNVPFASAYLLPDIRVGAVVGLVSATFSILAADRAGMPVETGPLIGTVLLPVICHSVSFLLKRLANERLELQNTNTALRNEIAEREKIEQALHATTVELSRKNSELTEALHTLEQAQLHMIQQEKMASIGHLAAGVAHEINNPLAFINSNIEILERYFAGLSQVLTQYRHLREKLAASGDCPLKDEVDLIAGSEKTHALDHILADFPGLFQDTTGGLDRINIIVKGMRRFSHFDQERVFGQYDLLESLESTLLIAHNEINRYADIEKDTRPIPPIEAVGGEINQVLLNLLVNAAQSIRAKGGSGRGMIRIATWHDEAYIYCAIEDNGAGIARQNLGSIFNPFFTTKPVGQGTGLGLSISYNIIVNDHNGDITVESAEGKGAKFTVKLPIKRGPGDTSPL